MAIIHKSTTRAGEDVEKGHSRALLVGMQLGAATVENSIEVPQKLKMEPPYGPAIPLLSIHI